MSMQMGKIARYWQNKDKRHRSLTQVTNKLVQKISARIRQPREARANRIDVLIGESGIGKSAILKKLSDRLTEATGAPWKSQVWHVASQGFEDNTGLPVIRKKKIGDHEQEVASFAKAEHVPGAVWRPHYTLGILDELPTAPPLIQNQLREMIDGQLNGEPLDPQCIYVGTGNPPDAKFITVNAIDDALEKRLKIYIVVPTNEELLQVWSSIMPDTIYKFLLVHPEFIDALSPREWEGVSKDVQDIRDGGGSMEEAIEEASDSLIDHPNVDVKLRAFIRHGDDPYYYPIRGQHILSASAAQLSQYMALLERWFDNTKRGFVGQTMQDLVRTLQGTPTEALEQQKTRAAQNLMAMIELLVARDAQDMGKMILEIALNGPLAVSLGRLLAKSAALADLSDAVKRFHMRKQRLSASATT